MGILIKGSELLFGMLPRCPWLRGRWYEPSRYAGRC